MMDIAVAVLFFVRSVNSPLLMRLSSESGGGPSSTACTATTSLKIYGRMRSDDKSCVTPTSSSSSSSSYTSTKFLRMLSSESTPR
jgi:hypothetical protein